MLLQKDKVSAVVTLVNFLLMSAGSQREWVAEDVDLEALEPEELDVLVRLHSCMLIVVLHLSFTAVYCLLASSVCCSYKT
jgi:hypothetical protein